MGVDLLLLPLIHESIWVSLDLIRIERSYELWDDINALSQSPIPKALSCYVTRDKKMGGTYYGDVEETPYGQRLQYATAGDLMTLSKHSAVQNNWRNRAVWAYLAAMPAGWPIVLFWHHSPD